MPTYTQYKITETTTTTVFYGTCFQKFNFIANQCLAGMTEMK